MEMNGEIRANNQTQSAAKGMETSVVKDEPKKGKIKKSPARKMAKKSLKVTSHLGNLLPKGSVLAFQTLSSVSTRQGKCQSIVSRTMTLALLVLCAVSCFLLCFVDTFRDDKGKVRHGVATRRGLWVLNGSSVSLTPDQAAKFRLRFVDFCRAFLSVIIFGAMATFDKNVVNCLYRSPSPEVQETLSVVPIVVGVICSLLLVALPSKRRGFGSSSPSIN